MSQCFLRCPKCRMPHDPGRSVCRITGERPALAKVSPPGTGNAPVRPPPLAPPGKPPPAKPPSDRSLVGALVAGKYAVRGVIGEGGMGTVFDARHVALGGALALKVLRPGHALKKPSVERFHREARAAGRVGHPNVCAVYDLDHLHDGRPYLVMERLVGETLGDRIARSGGLPFDDVVDVLIQALSALAAAHDKGVVHRDVKPDNLFLSIRCGCLPVVKLLDFGVSKAIGNDGAETDAGDLTRRGMVMGTPHYMAPEQARGDRDLDGRVDVYACGVVLYEALTGHRPFEAASYDTLLRQVLTGEPRAPRELRPGMPPSLELIVKRAMTRNRTERYGTAVEFQRALIAVRAEVGGKPNHSSLAMSASAAPSGLAHDSEGPTQLWMRGPPLDAAPTHVMRKRDLQARPRGSP